MVNELIFKPPGEGSWRLDPVHFPRMVRIADAIGIPLDDRSLSAADALIEELDIKTFHSASNTYRFD